MTAAVERAPAARVLSARVRPATLDEADELEIAPGAGLFELERLRLLDGLPVAVDSSRVPTGRCPGIEDVDFATASLYESLEARGIVPTDADVSIEALPAGDRHARLLDVERRAQQITAFVSNNHTRFARDQFGTNIVWMTADSRREPAAFQHRLHQRPQIGHEPIVPHHQFVKLPA